MSESKISSVVSQKAIIRKAGSQSALITDTSDQDFYFRELVYLGDETLAYITDHEGAFFVLNDGVSATIAGEGDVTRVDGNSKSSIN